MARASDVVTRVVGRWRAGWEQRYGRKAPKLESIERSKVAKLAERVSEADVLAGLDAYLADDWCERMAHKLDYFCKRADEYIQKAKRGGRHGATDPKGIIVEGDKEHEAECKRWRRAHPAEC